MHATAPVDNTVLAALIGQHVHAQSTLRIFQFYRAEDGGREFSKPLLHKLLADDSALRGAVDTSAHQMRSALSRSHDVNLTIAESAQLYPLLTAALPAVQKPQAGPVSNGLIENAAAQNSSSHEQTAVAPERPLAQPDLPVIQHADKGGVFHVSGDAAPRCPQICCVRLKFDAKELMHERSNSPQRQSRP